MFWIGLVVGLVVGAIVAAFVTLWLLFKDWTWM